MYVYPEGAVGHVAVLVVVVGFVQVVPERWYPVGHVAVCVVVFVQVVPERWYPVGQVTVLVVSTIFL